MRNPSGTVVCVVLSAFLAVSVPARSAEAAPVTLDQVVLPTGGGLGSSALAQTFTVGLTGGLVGVDVAAWSADPFVEFYLLGTTAGVPDASQILGVVTGVHSDRNSSRRLPANDLFLASFSKRWRCPGHRPCNSLRERGRHWGLEQTATPYSGGTAFNIPDGANGFAANLFVNEFGPLGIDAGFRTYVDADVATTPVPEPATLFLLGLGLAGAKMRLRRRKTAENSRRDT